MRKVRLGVLIALGANACNAPVATSADSEAAVASDAVVFADHTATGDAASTADSAAMTDASTAADATGSDGAVIAAMHPRIMLSHAPTRARLRAALDGNRPEATRFRTLVDAQLGGAMAYGYEPWYSALIGQLTGDARYCADAVRRTDAHVTSEESLIARAMRPAVAGDSYLEVGPIIGSLSIVYDYCYDGLTPTQRARWLAYAHQAVSNVWNPMGARWGSTNAPWSGWSVDNPVNNYYYSFLEATMLLGLASNGEHAMASQWLTKFRAEKIENQLIPTFNRDLQGGGSREGTGYGTAMRGLFRLYHLWETSTGEPLASRTPHTLASIAALLHNITPTLDRLAPTGDHARDSEALLFDYHRDYLQTLQTLFPSERLAAIAKSAIDGSSVPRSSQSFEFVWDFVYATPHITPRPLTELFTAYHAPGTGLIAARSSWARDATFAAIQCGPYSESHAHHDQGSFVLFKNGWLADDQNLRSRSGIEQGELMHNLVRIDDGATTIAQREGQSCELRALSRAMGVTHVSMRTTAMYQSPRVVRSEREWVMLDPDVVIVFDRVETNGSNVSRTFQLQSAVAPTQSGARWTFTQGARRLDAHVLSPATAVGAVRSYAAPDFTGGSRLELRDTTGASSMFLVVLAAQGAVTSATRMDVGGDLGAALVLSDGRRATVRFSPTAAGAFVELRAADNSVLTTGPRPMTVQALPLFN